MYQLLIPAVAGLLDKLIPDKEAAQAAKVKLVELQQQGQLQELASATAIILAEASGSWIQRNWRPLMMITFTALIVARWLGFAAPNLSEAEYIKLWEIVQLGLGGYVIGRTGEKMMETYVKGKE